MPLPQGFDKTIYSGESKSFTLRTKSVTETFAGVSLESRLADLVSGHVIAIVLPTISTDQREATFVFSIDLLNSLAEGSYEFGAWAGDGDNKTLILKGIWEKVAWAYK